MARTCASPRFSRVALLVVALAAAPAAAFSPSIPGAWSTGAQARAASMCQVAGRGGAGRSGVLSVGMSMGIEGMGIKEGAIGRGRGIPNKEMQELAAATITEQVGVVPGASSAALGYALSASTPP
ncbi:hypothetical protein T484DRAFT_1823582 [Baffinella frigidus]|nr:hypothetical protein T484DRAFT_1823582 [Cryptophyta sp. CCMP2293]